MTVETDKLCDDLRSWTRSPSIGLVEYSDDPTIQRRVGIMLSKYASKLSSGSKETDCTSCTFGSLPVFLAITAQNQTVILRFR